MSNFMMSNSVRQRDEQFRPKMCLIMYMPLILLARKITTTTPLSHFLLWMIHHATKLVQIKSCPTTRHHDHLFTMLSLLYTATLSLFAASNLKSARKKIGNDVISYAF